MMIAGRSHVTPSVSEGSGRRGAAMSSPLRDARPSRSLANARNDTLISSTARSHGSAVYFDAIAQPRAQAAPLESSRDQRSYDTSSSPRTPHSLHAQPEMIISAGVNASAIAAQSPPMRRTTASTAM